MPASVVIIGGGISGLATAYFLGRLGIPSVLIEKTTALGGLIQTDRVEGCVLEGGPDSYLAAKPDVTELASQVPALQGQIIGSNDAARRIFVARASRLLPMPRGMVLMVPADFRSALRSPLFSPRTKLRLIAERLSPRRIREGDVSVGELIGSHFGAELLDYVAEPLLAGVYGGDSATLSARSVLPRFLGYEEKYGSLARAVQYERREAPATGSLFLSFRDGMQTLTDALARAAADSMTVLHAEVTRLEHSSGKWRISQGGQSLIEAEHVVLACPAHIAALLLEPAAPTLASELAAIPCSSAILVTLVYDRSTLGHPLDGFGFLVPRTERRTIAAATWVSTKFPSRAPAELAVLRAFIVAEEARQLLTAPEADLIQLVRADFRRWMGIDAAPRFSTVHFWPRSMPQYVVGHQKRVGRIDSALAEQPGLHLAGNAYDGIGIPDCVRRAKQTAKAIFATTIPS